MSKQRKPFSYQLGLLLRRLLGLKANKTVSTLKPADFAKYYRRPDWLLLLLVMVVWTIPGLVIFLIPSSEPAIYFTIWLIIGVLTFLTVFKRRIRISLTEDCILMESDGAKTSIKYSELYKIVLRPPSYQEDPVCFLILETKNNVSLKVHENSIEDFDSILRAFKERKLQVDDLVE